MSASGIVHCFTTSLENSHRLNNESDWVAFYKRIWPDATMIIRLDADSQMQRNGIDRIIMLPSGKQLLIDEKCREKDYGDVLLETVSVRKRKEDGSVVDEKIGWALDDSKHCDFVAYAIPSASKCYLLPFQLTKEALRVNLVSWSRNERKAKNNGYETVNVAVKWAVLYEAIKEVMYRKFGTETKLPPVIQPTDKSQPFLFEW